jgi:heat shock protein HtpX
MNRLKTLVLLSTLTALLLWAGHAMAGQGGLVLALMFAVVMNFGAYWWSDKIVLRMYGAREVTEAQAPALHSLVRELAGRAGEPMPKVYSIPRSRPTRSPPVAIPRMRRSR